MPLKFYQLNFNILDHNKGHQLVTAKRRSTIIKAPIHTKICVAHHQINSSKYHIQHYMHHFIHYIHVLYMYILTCVLMHILTCVLALILTCPCIGVSGEDPNGFSILTLANASSPNILRAYKLAAKNEHSPSSA